ncbi:unnamed protein product, partial [Didymodactylos carnosus]
LHLPFDIILFMMSYNSAITTYKKFDNILVSKICCDCKLICTCLIEQGTKSSSISILCHRAVLVMSEYFQTYFKYNQPESLFDDEQQAYINVYKCTFECREETLRFCIDLLYQTLSLAGNGQMEINFDNLEDILNMMMFLCLSKYYFQIILIPLLKKMLNEQEQSSVYGEHKRLLCQIVRSSFDKSIKKNFLRRTLCLLNDDDRTDLLEYCFIEHIYSPKSYFDPEENRLILGPNEPFEHQGVVYSIGLIESSSSQGDTTQFWFKSERLVCENSCTYAPSSVFRSQESPSDQSTLPSYYGLATIYIFNDLEKPEWYRIASNTTLVNSAQDLNERYRLIFPLKKLRLQRNFLLPYQLQTDTYSDR